MTLHTPYTSRPASLLPARPLAVFASVYAEGKRLPTPRALRLLRLRSVYRNVRSSLSMPAREAFGVARQAIT